MSPLVHAFSFLNPNYITLISHPLNNKNSTTVNPYNTTLTCGGSSGGEGALLGLRGSALGIGTDIGGSIRSPAANNGVFGFKATAGRLPVSGWSATMAGADSILPTIGPLSTSLEGIRIFVKTVLDARPWLREPSLVAFPWREKEKEDVGEEKRQGRKLRVGVIGTDGVVRPHPPVWSALGDVVEKLSDSGQVELVEWECWRHDLAWEIIVRLLLLSYKNSLPRISCSSITCPFFNRSHYRLEESFLSPLFFSLLLSFLDSYDT